MPLAPSRPASHSFPEHQDTQPLPSFLALGYQSGAGHLLGCSWVCALERDPKACLGTRAKSSLHRARAALLTDLPSSKRIILFITSQILNSPFVYLFKSSHIFTTSVQLRYFSDSPLPPLKDFLYRKQFPFLSLLKRTRSSNFLSESGNENITHVRVIKQLNLIIMHVQWN